MAKSLRSKWRRKMRAVKRERYGKKELDRLKKTLGIDNIQESSNDETMKDLSEIVTFTTAEEIKEKTQIQEKDVVHASEVEEIQKFNPKTLRNENGAYPTWLHPRKIKKCKKAKNKKKKTKSKGKISKKT
ncbi:hypothetical protein JTB14_037377 [Gonioctena quinquepunctata]|nr:hypothetical protein JTB14_037377 [Gonioctena quinquepunctata]